MLELELALELVQEELPVYCHPLSQLLLLLLLHHMDGRPSIASHPPTCSQAENISPVIKCPNKESNVTDQLPPQHTAYQHHKPTIPEGP